MSTKTKWPSTARTPAWASLAINSISAGEKASTQAVAGNANIVDVVNSVNSAELTLDTVVAVRDKVVAAYQSIMTMPI